VAVAVAATSAMLSSLNGLAVDASNNVYISDCGNNMVRKVDATTGIITTVVGTGTAGSTADGVAGTAALLNAPAGLALDASGNLYIADEGNFRVSKLSLPAGTLTTYAGSTTQTGGCSGDSGAATSALLQSPFGLAFDTSSNLYISDYRNHNVRVVTASTKIISNYAGLACGSAGAPTAGTSGDGGQAASAFLYKPQGIAIDISNVLYIADYVRDGPRHS
jgi:DNA-binding beta-propeller fold protein YncE